MNVMLKLLKGIAYSKGVHIGSLDGYERLIASLYGTPDRVPVLIQPYLYAMNLHGLSSEEFFHDPKKFMHASYNMATYFGADSFSPVFDFYNIEAEALGQPYIWQDLDEPSVNKEDFLIKHKKDLFGLKPPKPGETGRMPYVIESYKRFIEIMGIPPMCYCCAPFSLAVLIRGLTNLIMDMIDDPDFVHDLMNFLSTEVCIPWIKTMIKETGTAMVVMSDAQASPPIISPDMIRQFCLPYVEKIIRATSTPQCTVLDTGVWGEGEVKHPHDMLDIKMDMMLPGNNFKALRPFFILAWKEDYEKTGIPVLRHYAEDKGVNLMLNVPPLLFMRGTTGEIVETVRMLIKQGAGNGKFALLLNMIPPDVPVGKVHTAVAAAHQFGRYPISTDIDKLEFQPPSFTPFETWVKQKGLPV
ncbi:MAG: hypothetical protein JW920_09765 [Deltaproteobacteria bacterium]|nr:hypothetical protein [Deltaproteobacteria bacterium]